MLALLTAACRAAPLRSSSAPTRRLVSSSKLQRSALPSLPLPTPPAAARDKILLNGLEFIGRHGVHRAERELGQRFIVDAELSTCLQRAGESCALHDTVDYSRVHADVRAIVEGEPVELLEVRNGVHVVVGE